MNGYTLKNEKVQPLTVLWTLKSDSEAISLSNSSVAEVAEGFGELEKIRQMGFNKPTKPKVSFDLSQNTEEKMTAH